MLHRATAMIGACALVLASVFAIRPAQPIQGDVNRDGAVDVLDLQALIAEIDGPASRNNADVNADGNVDVRDLQRVVANQLLGIEPSDETPPESPDAIPAPTVPQQRVFPAGALTSQSFVVAQASISVASPATDFAALFPSQDTFRALFGLAPNAPPSFA